MGTNTKGFRTYVDNYGPSGAVFASANLALAITTGALTVNESQGFTSIAKSTTGRYVLTLLRAGKNATVTLGVGGTSPATAQDIRVVSKVGNVITIQVTTAGTAAEVLAATTIDVLVLLRTAV